MCDVGGETIHRRKAACVRSGLMERAVEGERREAGGRGEVGIEYRMTCFP